MRRICSVKPGRLAWSNSNRGAATKLPPKRPRLRSIRPLASIDASACRNVIRLTPRALDISTSDGNLSPGANVWDTINCSSQLPMRVWAGKSPTPDRSGRSTSSGSSIVNTRTSASLGRGTPASAVSGANPMQQVVHDLVLEAVADGTAHPRRTHPSLLPQHPQRLGDRVLRSTQRRSQVANADPGCPVQAQQDLKPIRVREQVE